MLLLLISFFPFCCRSKIDSDFQCAAIPKGDGWNCYQKVVSQENTCDGAWYKANSTVVSNGITYTVYIGTVGNPSTFVFLFCFFVSLVSSFLVFFFFVAFLSEV